MRSCRGSSRATFPRAAAHGDIAHETEIVMTAIGKTLDHIGLGMERIVRVDVHLTDISRMAEFDRVYRDSSRAAPCLPARAPSRAASPADRASRSRSWRGYERAGHALRR